MKSEFLRVFKALIVISSRFPIGVETMYKPLKRSVICQKKILTITTYILFFLNINSFADENKRYLKIGLLAPFSGEYKDIGQSIMLSLQLALKEIGDDNIIIFPRDSGFNNQQNL